LEDVSVEKRVGGTDIRDFKDMKISIATGGKKVKIRGR
jgi:hypothetical protein